MRLSKSVLPSLASDKLATPPLSVFDLPERVLQFGTGVLLRALPDYFIDLANRRGEFNGRIVVVKSTDGSTHAFNEQDGLYTLVVKGYDNGKVVEEHTVCSAISRVLSAKESWEDLVRVASSPELSVVISNTTEVGLRLNLEKIGASAPDSFPAKLLALLIARYQTLPDARGRLVVVPTELVPDNGALLKSYVLEQAKYNALSDSFVEWLNTHITFCSSLVDRIVPGKPDQHIRDDLKDLYGYEDELMIVAEPYTLWAIEGDDRVREILSFSKCHAGVIVAPDIDLYRELKLRLLNGTHTLCCGMAYLSGFETVVDAMNDSNFRAFAEKIMKDEIAPSIPFSIDAAVKEKFANQVLDRFRNPNIQHRWISITLQYSSKVKMRVLPVLLKHYESMTEPPAHIAVGFAAWMLFMKSVFIEEGRYYGILHGQRYLISDDCASFFKEAWKASSSNEVASKVLGNVNFWGVDLNSLPGFSVVVSDALEAFCKDGVKPYFAQH